MLSTRDRDNICKNDIYIYTRDVYKRLADSSNGEITATYRERLENLEIPSPVC